MKLKRILMIVLSIMLVMLAVGGCLALSSAGGGGTSSGGSSSASGSVGGSGNLGGSSGSGGGTSVHTHSFTTVIESENCTEGGTVTKTCKTCGYTETSESAPTQHILVKVAEKAATCTEEGFEAYEYCTKCEYSTEAEAGVIPVIDHDMVAQEDKAPTCTETGYTNYSICSVCGKESDKTLVPVIEHDMVAVTDIEPTCTEVGYTGVTVCSMCGMVSEGTEVPALGHDEVTHEDKAATCTETGYTGYVTCSRCDYSTMTETPLAAHTYENGTCSVCGTVEIKDLTGTTWLLNESPNLATLPRYSYSDTVTVGDLYRIYSINESDEGEGYNFYAKQNQRDGEYCLCAGVGIQYKIPGNSYITFTGGEDATNINLISWLKNNAVMVEGEVEQSYYLRGTWELNEELNLSDFEFHQEVAFVSNGNSYSGFSIVHPQPTPVGAMLQYIPNDTNNSIYSEVEFWSDEAFRVVEFGEIGKVVDKYFYAWFIVNAEKIG